MNAHSRPDASAPYYEDVTDSPEARSIEWRTAADGVRLRVGVLGRGARGTVLIFPGRTEYLEKYGPTCRAFEAAGMTSVIVDWRGQGLSDRLLERMTLGHVEQFLDYQNDVEALVRFAQELALPKPWYLLAHSMGGAIGLRALHRGLPVKAAVFSAPMWGLTMPAILRPAGRILPQLAQLAGLQNHGIPGTSPTHAYALRADPDDNLLTSDAETFIWLRRQVHAHPDLGLAAPTLRWLREALLECDALMQLPFPKVPTRLFLGTNERIVCPDCVRKMAAAHPHVSLTELERGEHEVLMERPDLRAQVRTGALEVFAAHP